MTERKSRSAPPAAGAKKEEPKAPAAPKPEAKSPDATPAPVEEAQADGEKKIDLMKPYSMVWVGANKHYYQDGVVYDKVYKTPLDPQPKG